MDKNFHGDCEKPPINNEWHIAHEPGRGQARARTLYGFASHCV